ncbi:hypothetical protein [Enhygromyxa salina]|uniref:hypothetical protein n=1 Tax=Enhygromyxa salina TaxID=215803 RepID=UPI000D093399|nr:hypothetical protein [Enhygromyxa salina]
MSDDKDPERGDAKAPDQDGAKVDTENSDDGDTDDAELDDLDGEGFDRAVADARDRVLSPGEDLDPDLGERPYTAEEAGLRSKAGWGRSPIISAAVIVVGLFLLIATWSDFRYFLRSAQSEPRDLGTVSEIYQDGEFSERFDNEWVVLEGDPDVQHAARMQGRDGWIGFLRLIEADASLFVSIPRATQNTNNEFPGRFEGRMRRISEVPQWDKLQTFFNAEEITDIIDLDPASVASALGSGARKVALVDGGELELAPDDKLRVVVAQSSAMVQLGRTTWPTRAQADEIMKVLGKPWAFVEKRDTVWVYTVALGADASLELFQELTRALNNGEDLASADPKVGGLVLPRRATYLVDFGDLSVDGAGDSAELSFTYGSNTAGTGWKVEGDALVPVPLDGGRLAVPSAAIEAVRVERSLVADPKGYLLMVDQHPKDVWPSAVMFGAVFGVVLLNAWALLVALRRRRSAELS